MLSNLQSVILFLQVEVVDRLCHLQGQPPLLANPDLGWNTLPLQRMTARMNPPGYRVTRMGDRQQLQTVSALNSS